MTKAPHHKLWSFTSWVIDAYFADEETYEGVFRPLGIGCRPLRYYRKKDIIDGVVQIDIPVCNEPLDILGYRYKICPVCGSVRYDNSDVPSPCFPLPEHPGHDLHDKLDRAAPEGLPTGHQAVPSRKGGTAVWNIRPPAATIRSCASSLKWLAPLRPLPKMTNQKKTDYICISKESEGLAPDTLDETLPWEWIYPDYVK